MEYLNSQECKELVNETLRQLRCSDLVDKITVYFYDRFRSSGGDANYTKRRIRLSSRIFPHKTVEQRRQSIIHEACHIVVRHLYGYGAKPHGWQWKNCMISMGLEPERCHDIDVYALGISKRRQRKPKEVAQCYCADGCRVGPIVAKRIRQGLKYRCGKCGATLKLGGMTETGNAFLQMQDAFEKGEVLTPAMMEPFTRNIKAMSQEDINKLRRS